MRINIAAVIFDTKKNEHDYAQIKTTYNGEDMPIDIMAIDEQNNISQEHLLEILYEHRGYDAIITIGDNPFIDVLNKMPFLFRKKWYHFSTFNAEDIVNAIVGTMAFNIGREDENFPQFSIFTCAYKTDKETALRLYKSLLRQSYQEWNWWIIDDSPYYYQSYFSKIKDPRIHIIRNETTHGNIGFNKHVIAMACDGKYLVEVDHDDELSYDCLEYLKKAFDTYTDIGFAYSYGIEEIDGQIINYGEGFALGLGKHEEKDFEGTKYLIPLSADINCLSMRHIVGLPNHVRCWKASCYKELGGHNIEISVLDDQELLTRTLMRYKSCKIPKILYVQHEGCRDEKNARGGTSTQSVRFNEIKRLGYILKDRYDKEIHDFFLKNNMKDPYWNKDINSSIISEGVKDGTENINYILDIE